MLRKVIYQIGNGKPTNIVGITLEEERKHVEEETKLRDGYFHKWVGEDRVRALIEDADTRKVLYIDIDNITFAESPETKDLT